MKVTCFRLHPPELCILESGEWERLAMPIKEGQGTSVSRDHCLVSLGGVIISENDGRGGLDAFLLLQMPTYIGANGGKIDVEDKVDTLNG